MNDHAAVIDASFFLGAFLSEFCSDEERRQGIIFQKLFRTMARFMYHSFSGLRLEMC